MADAKFSFQEKAKLYHPAWVSPEALLRRPEDSNVKSADMWSFAVVLWELQTRQVPFADLEPMEIGMRVCQPQFTFLILKHRKLIDRFTLLCGSENMPNCKNAVIILI